MQTTPTGEDPPYPAPLILPGEVVRPEWIDYNGHMNVAYYMLVFDRAMDHLFDNVLGIGQQYVWDTKHGPYAMQSHIHYLGELLEGARFDFEAQLVDCDQKRLHVFVTMRNAAGEPAATFEQMVMNVDLERRRAAPYPDWAQARIDALMEAHSRLPKPAQLGAPLGIRRK